MFSTIAKDLLIDEREFSFIFIETVMPLATLPSIANVSFALNRLQEENFKGTERELFNKLMEKK